MASSHVIFVLGAAIVMAVACGGGAWIYRRVRKPQLIRMLLLLGAGLVLAANTFCLLVKVADLWAAAVIAASLACGAALAALLLSWRVKAVHATLPRRVLAIGAHPDDLELACGGTLAKFIDSGHEVNGLIMSDGRVGGDVGERSKEAHRGAAFMGLTSIRHFDFTDTRLAEHGQEMVNAIEEAIRRFNPDIILTHSKHDQHQDHQAVHDATLRAARQHHSILCYESPSATRDFNPSVFIDIEDYVEAKVRAVQVHRDQAGKPYMTPARVRGVAAFRGSQAKRAAAEGYEPVRLLTSELRNP
ncbi:PIG-L deacetylase family protein [Arthrobacter sp. GCM10027362]|uniref:PIG-L deacetylase family protein n=1 Tax=Arthrobacter sp. GCM10027362 TaxID=3273379 RepID=UPI00363DF757